MTSDTTQLAYNLSSRQTLVFPLQLESKPGSGVFSGKVQLKLTWAKLSCVLLPLGVIVFCVDFHFTEFIAWCWLDKQQKCILIEWLASLIVLHHIFHIESLNSLAKEKQIYLANIPLILTRLDKIGLCEVSSPEIRQCLMFFTFHSFFFWNHQQMQPSFTEIRVRTGHGILEKSWIFIW